MPSKPGTPVPLSVSFRSVTCHPPLTCVAAICSPPIVIVGAAVKNAFTSGTAGRLSVPLVTRASSIRGASWPAALTSSTSEY